MGSLHATEMADMVDLDTGLVWHLQHNHYPPLPLSLVETCKQAISAANDEDWDRLIPLPDGVLFRGEDHAPTDQIVTQHHLDAWINNEEVFE